MAKKTDSQAIDSLFDAFADTLTNLIKNGKTVVDKETGEAVKVTPDAATLNVVRQFLERNGGTVLAGSNKKVNDLAGILPFNGEEYDDTLPYQ